MLGSRLYSLVIIQFLCAYFDIHQCRAKDVHALPINTVRTNAVILFLLQTFCADPVSLLKPFLVKVNL